MRASEHRAAESCTSKQCVCELPVPSLPSFRSVGELVLIEYRERVHSHNLREETTRSVERSSARDVMYLGAAQGTESTQAYATSSKTHKDTKLPGHLVVVCNQSRPNNREIPLVNLSGGRHVSCKSECLQSERLAAVMWRTQWYGSDELCASVGSCRGACLP